MIYNNNNNNNDDDDDDDDDACINDVIQIVTYNFNKFWIFFVSNWIAGQYFYFRLGFSLKNKFYFVLMRDCHITY